MPRGDGTGPPWDGGLGTGRGGGRGGRGAGRMGGTRPGTGSGGDCVCPACEARVPHQAGDPCYETKCPKCGTPMVRG